MEEFSGKKSPKVSQMENGLNICGFLFHKIGRADIEGSKSNIAMKAWLPYKAVMSVVMVGYPGSRGRVLDASSNAGCGSITIATK